MHVFSDFDGTISVKDTTDEILSRFALPEWEIIEEEWKAGKIGSAECMQKQIALIRANRSELDQALDEAEIDSGFHAFSKFCENKNIPLTIISDGVDYFIKRILVRNDLERLPIIANTFAMSENGDYSLSSSHTNPECSFGYGVCKCKQIAAAKGLKIFVGDGRSDFCAVHKADVVFAKGTLAKYCDEQKIKYNNYSNFAEIHQAIQAMGALVEKQTITETIYLNSGEYHGDYA